MYKPKKLLLIVLVLSLTFVLAGCLGSSEFTVVESNLAKEDLGSVDSSLAEIKIKFNQQLSQAEVVLTENGGQVDQIEVETKGQQLTISNLDFNAVSHYQLTAKATSQQGNQLAKKVEFTTQRQVEVTNPNSTMMQTFYWGIGEDGPQEEMHLWNLLAKRASKFAKLGITDLWLPPAHKDWKGYAGMGYGTNDIWDLGEFKQHGSVRTRYGTKAELKQALDSIHQAGMDAYYDAILNHRLGADKTEQVTLAGNSQDLAGEKIDAWTYFKFKGRQKYYSRADEWNWNWKNFDGVDYADQRGQNGKFLFRGKEWDDTYSKDYLMGSDVDYQNSNVQHELKEWGSWIVNEINFDGYRIDAVKHIDSNFTNDWIKHLRKSTDKELFFVGEAWEESVSSLVSYLQDVGNSNLRVFDFALRKAFANYRSLNMKELATKGLVNHPQYHDQAVTFVDNHDTDRKGNQYGSAVPEEFKYQAYTYILMQENGVPNIYWKDYYNRDMKLGLDKLLKTRQRFAYGAGYPAESNDSQTFSYVRAGSQKVPGSGLVMMITKGDNSDLITKQVDTGQPNTTFIDYIGHIKGTIKTDQNGVAEFKVQSNLKNGWSVWVPVN